MRSRPHEDQSSIRVRQGSSFLSTQLRYRLLRFYTVRFMLVEHLLAETDFLTHGQCIQQNWLGWLAILYIHPMNAERQPDGGC